ncbi:MAG: hypothetical protein WKF96_13740 [Solirubrobacteraceae bacterium]
MSKDLFQQPSSEDLYELARGSVIGKHPELVGGVHDNATLDDLGDDAEFFARIDAEHARLCAAAGIKLVNTF